MRTADLAICVGLLHTCLPFKLLLFGPLHVCDLQMRKTLQQSAAPSFATMHALMSLCAAAAAAAAAAAGCCCCMQRGGGCFMEGSATADISSSTITQVSQLAAVITPCCCCCPV
jgi:hypothetical protein